MAIKKVYEGLHAFLVANENKKVSTVMGELTELMSAKGAGGAASSIHRNAAGEIVAIFDYYFKKWLPVKFVEYGMKANSASGLNTMCKLGTSLWTKQQREFKKGKELLLEQVAAGEIQPTDIQVELEKLETARGYVAAYPVPELAFDSVEDLEAADPVAMQAALDAYLELVALQEAEEAKAAEEAAAAKAKK